MSERKTENPAAPVFPEAQSDRLFRTLIDAVGDYAILMLDPGDAS